MIISSDDEMALFICREVSQILRYKMYSCLCGCSFKIAILYAAFLLL